MLRPAPRDLDPNRLCDTPMCCNYIRVGFDCCLRCLVAQGVLCEDGVLAPSRPAIASASLAGDAAARKAAPMFSGLLAYFPNALAAVAHVSKVGNDQHNPGLPMQWAFNKSTDEADCIVRHQAEAGTFDTSGTEPVRHSAKVAWRALAQLERELLASDPTLKPGRSVTGYELAEQVSREREP
jgi:hypothetical protein